jgi:hypothetical protein
MGRQHRRRGTVGKNQYWQRLLYTEDCFEKIIELLQHTGQQNWIFILKPCFHQNCRCELHKSNIHGKAAIAEPLITESNAQMCKWLCHDHKIWMSTGNASVMWSDDLSFTLFAKSGSVYISRTPKEAYNLECLVPTVKHGGGFVMVWAAVSWYNILLVPLLPFMAELLQGSTWAGWVIRCIPWSGHFRTMQFSKTIMPIFI